MRILYSQSRTRLRSQCLKEVSELATSYPDHRAILIVPEQTKMDIEEALVRRHDGSVLMMVEVLSFRRLAWRLLGEIGQVPNDALGDIGKSMLIHRVLDENRERLHTFGHLADKPGFIRQAAAALGDVRRYCIDSQQLEQAADSAQDKSLQNKTMDLAILLAGYDKAMLEYGFGDSEDDLNRLGQVLETLPALSARPWPWPLGRLEWLANCSIWISGFGELRDFTPQEDAIIMHLERLCKQLSVTVSADHVPMDRQGVDDGAECLLNGRRTANRLLHGFPGSRLVKLPDDRQGMAAGVATAIRDGAPCPVPEAGDMDWVSLVKAEGVPDELDYVAGRIRQLVMQSDYRYQDIAIGVCNMPAYAGPLRAALRKYDIPLFLDVGRPLIGTPLARFVMALLDIGLYNWPMPMVVRCLRTGLSPLSANEVDRLENEMLARGLTRYSRLMDNSRYTDSDLPPIRDRALMPVRDLLKAMGGAERGAEKCRILYRFLCDYGVRQKLEDLSADLVAQSETEPAVTMVQSWNELLKVLEQMTRLAGDTTMKQKTFRDLLAAGLDTAGNNVIPTAIDQVAAGELRRTMLRQPKILFLVGANAADLPPALPPEGLLGDQDRQALSGLVGRQLPSSARDQVFSDAFVLYTLLSLPSDRLEMTAPGEDVSAWFSWLAKAMPEAVKKLTCQRLAGDPRNSALRPAFAALLGFCRQDRAADDHSGWTAIARTLASGGLPVMSGLQWISKTRHGDVHNKVRLPSDLVMELYGGKPAMSVSQLETYASCPFRHLATYLLSLREREIWQPEAAAAGILLHQVIELALQDLKIALSSLDPMDTAARRKLLGHWIEHGMDQRIDRLIAQACDNNHLRVFLEPGIRASDGRRASRMAQSSLAAILRQYGQNDYSPSSLEWTFGPAESNTLSLELPGKITVEFAGKIDRVDQHAADGGPGFRIIDYKSGDKKADYDALYHGLALQLPAYLEAYARNNSSLVPEDAAYFQFSRPILPVSSGNQPDPDELLNKLDQHFKLRSLKLSPDEIQLLCRHTMLRVSSLSSELLTGDFGIIPRKLNNQPLACTYCDLQAVCGFDLTAGTCRYLKPLSGSGKKQQLMERICEELEKDGDSHVQADT